MKKGFIYITTNTVNNKKYIGKKYYQYRGGKRSYWEHYLGSSKLLKEDIKSLGADSFTREIIDEAETKEELAALEKYYIDKYNAVFSDEYYNLSNNVDKFFTTDESIQKILETRERWSDKKREEVSERMKKSWADNYEERCESMKGQRGEEFSKMRSDVQKEVYANMSDQEKQQKKDKLSAAGKKHWSSLTDEQKQEHHDKRAGALEKAWLTTKAKKEQFLDKVVLLVNIKEDTEQQMTIREVVDFGIPYHIIRAMLNGKWSTHNRYKRTWTIK
jgi:hypothetical protein